MTIREFFECCEDEFASIDIRKYDIDKHETVVLYDSISPAFYNHSKECCNVGEVPDEFLDMNIVSFDLTPRSDKTGEAIWIEFYV